MTRPEAPSDPPRQHVRLAGGLAAYIDEGPRSAPHGAPCCLLLHGAPGSARDFRWLAPALCARGVRVVRVDLPGFGETPQSTDPGPSAEARARFAMDVSCALELATPLVVGHSLGGPVATALASFWPDAVAGLALIASPGLRPHRFLRTPHRALDRLLQTPLRRPLRPVVRRLFRAMGFRRGDTGEFLRSVRCVSGLDLPAHAARLRRLRVPSLHVFCDDDPIIEAAIMAEAAATSGGRTLRFSTGGHNPQKRYAHEIALALRGLLDLHINARTPAHGP